MNTYWVYILASKPYGTLYIGVTNNLLGRVEAHRDGTGSKFTSRYRVHKLVYYEPFDASPRRSSGSPQPSPPRACYLRTRPAAQR